MLVAELFYLATKPSAGERGKTYLLNKAANLTTN
jgi:hypothetical protein